MTDKFINCVFLSFLSHMFWADRVSVGLRVSTLLFVPDYQFVDTLASGFRMHHLLLEEHVFCNAFLITLRRSRSYSTEILQLSVVSYLSVVIITT